MSFGSWATFGVKDESDVDSLKEMLKMGRDAGINFIDTAEAYGKNNGDAEVMLGRSLKELGWDRSSYVLSTKLFWGPGSHVNRIGTSRKHLLEGLDASLKRLQHDYVDLVFAHRHDAHTTIE